MYIIIDARAALDDFLSIGQAFHKYFEISNDIKYDGFDIVDRVYCDSLTKINKILSDGKWHFIGQINFAELKFSGLSKEEAIEWAEIDRDTPDFPDSFNEYLIIKPSFGKLPKIKISFKKSLGFR